MKISININNDLALVLAKIARKKALKIKVPMVIAFTDAGCGLIHFQKMDNALPASVDIALNKAFTAAGLRMPTHGVAEVCQPGQPLYGLQHGNQGRIVIFGGGFPLLLQNSVAGAIGVSGGTVEQDMQVALSAVTALAEMEDLACKMKELLPAELNDYASVTKQLESNEKLNDMDPELLRGALCLLSGYSKI